MGNPPKTFATRSNSGAALERITPAGARIYEILHHPEAFTVQTIAAAEHIKGRYHAKVVMAREHTPTARSEQVERLKKFLSADRTSEA